MPQVFRAATEIAARPAAVWAVVTDLDGWPAWQGVMRLTAEPLNVGARGILAVEIDEGRGLRAPARITALVPARRLQARNSGWAAPFFARKFDVVLTEREDLGTRAEVSLAFTGLLAAALARTILAAGAQSAVERFAEALKARVEADTARR